MGVETLYTILSQKEDGGRHFFIVKLDPAHDIYRGHFPGMPVTPGVCSLHMIRACAGRILDAELRYDSIKECKFLSSIIPGKHDKVEIRLYIEPDEGAAYKTECSVHVGDEVMLKLKAHFIQA